MAFSSPLFPQNAQMMCILFWSPRQLTDIYLKCIYPFKTFIIIIIITNREVDWSKYKPKRNYVNNAIKRAKKIHYTKLLNESVSKPEKFWKSIKEVFPTKNKIDSS